MTSCGSVLVVPRFAAWDNLSGTAVENELAVDVEWFFGFESACDAVDCQSERDAGAVRVVVDGQRLRFKAGDG